MGQLVIIIIVIGLSLLILRLFGAWMLRIDELISEQKRTNEILIEGFNKVNRNIKNEGGGQENDTEPQS